MFFLSQLELEFNFNIAMLEHICSDSFHSHSLHMSPLYTQKQSEEDKEREREKEREGGQSLRHPG